VAKDTQQPTSPPPEGTESEDFWQRYDASVGVPSGVVYDADKGTVSMPIQPELLEQTRAEQAAMVHARGMIDEREKRTPAHAPLHGSVDSGTWIANEVKRMKAAAEIPDSVTKTNFAEALAERMRIAAEADRSIRPIKGLSISNRLKDWGLWPIDKIST
jgi:hypothetical protein